MKRFLSLILAFLLALSPLSGLNLRASAAEIITISEITMPEIPTLGKGDSTDLSWAVAPAGESYDCSTIACSTEGVTVTARTFASGVTTGTFYYHLVIQPKAGYSFGGTVVLVTLDKLEAEQSDDGNQGGTGDGNQGNTPSGPSGGGGQSSSTGDMSNLSAYVTVMMMALCGLCYLLLVVRKRTNA